MQKGVVLTNGNCIGCNKCISVCSSTGACVSVKTDRGLRIDVDENRCVACGACFDVCEHHAREFRDDTYKFINDLKNGENISLLVAPSFVANYFDNYKEILGGLKSLGLKHVYNVSFGADISTWGYLNYIKKYNVTCGISQPCPVVVRYIEHYEPELIPSLFPVQSPLMCLAIYCRKVLNNTDKLAFLSPCIAKKLEIDDENNKGYISYNVTFKHLVDYVKQNNLQGEFDSFDYLDAGLGKVYPMTGGLKENVYWFLGENVFIRQIEGEKEMCDWLSRNKAKILNKSLPYTMIDALNCSKGCLYGTGCEADNIDNEDIFCNLLAIKDKTKKNIKTSPWSIKLKPKQRLERFNRQFKDLNLEDYMRSYTDRSSECSIKIPNDAEKDTIFNSMYKFSEIDRSINCSCCGYDSCTKMVEAIYNGFNCKENCIYYNKYLVELKRVEAEKLSESLEREKNFINRQNKLILDVINEINHDFDVLHTSIKESEAGNTQNASDSQDITNDMSVVMDFIVSLCSNMEEIEQNVEEFNKTQSEVITMAIASQTNLVALKTSLDMFEANNNVKSVANEIKNIVKATTNLSDKNNECHSKLTKSIFAIITAANNLKNIVNDVNSKIDNLASETEELASINTIILDISDRIKAELYKLSEHKFEEE